MAVASDNQNHSYSSYEWSAHSSITLVRSRQFQPNITKKYMTSSSSALPTSVTVYRLRVAVPVYLFDCFDYKVTAQQYAQAEVGARVKVSFGRQQLIGIIIEKVPTDAPMDTRFKLKAIDELLDENALLDTKILKLLQWSAQYYHFPIGEVLHSALPTFLRQGLPYDLYERYWKVCNAHANVNLNKAKKQKIAYETLLESVTGMTETSLLQQDISKKTLTALAEKNLIQHENVAIKVTEENNEILQTPLTANTEQQYAIDQVLHAQQHYQAFLLDGLTGSGKTEVYLQIMQEVLKQGKQILVLVPEIGLTPQTIQRFRSRFACTTVILHSALNDTKRLAAWQAAQTGQASIILGTRSAIYTPLPRLGLIILDEEHDLSFKQQEGFRYHARDVGMYRAYTEKCPIILGSATPSVDSYALVKQQKMIHLTLNQRAGGASLPNMHVIDLKIAKKQQGLSQQLLNEIRLRLERQEQVLIFLNRRGYAPVIMCEACSWQAKCPYCDANFTLHLKPYQHLHCHHCGTVHRVPDHCPECQQKELKAIGLGTAKVEETLQGLFPEVDILRVDRDSTSRVGAWQNIYDQIHQNKPTILLGTQMLAKGHHFPFVTLVAILEIDSGLFSVDFRAAERTAQLIMQVAGRAGRGERKGDVYLQSLRPDHPLFQTLMKKDYRAFAQNALLERQQAQFPPFRYAALIRCESRDQNVNLPFLQQHAQQLRELNQGTLDIWGPIPAPMERKAGRYQAHMVLLASERGQLHQHLQHWWQTLLKAKPTHMKLSLDIDPQEFS